jgi:hypothetical protein
MYGIYLRDCPSCSTPCLSITTVCKHALPDYNCAHQTSRLRNGMA